MPPGGSFPERKPDPAGSALFRRWSLQLCVLPFLAALCSSRIPGTTALADLRLRIRLVRAFVAVLFGRMNTVAGAEKIIHDNGEFYGVR